MTGVPKPPDEIYGELFEAVQLSGIFADSKTFVDSVPRQQPDEIVEAYASQRHEPGFDLKVFVVDHFDIPTPGREASTVGTEQSLREYIGVLWDVLYREADEEVGHSSLIPLPHPYIVPGGRFREIYYWDSYFTMLGLAACGRLGLIQSMVENFAYLIGKIGFVPNGNRSYYCTRSQPPFFACMLTLLARQTGSPEVLAKYVDALESEYRFWMSGIDDLAGAGTTSRRLIAADGGWLNRYWDDMGRPRQESYAEDLHLAAQSTAERARLFLDIRAACESGWDFSSRWLADIGDFSSIRTTQVVPVDLNAIMFHVESTLAEACEHAGRGADGQRYRERAKRRKRLIRELFFDEASGLFRDLQLPDLRPTSCASLASAYPLFFGIASPDQAASVARMIDRQFLRPGGWVTTTVNSGQQWDAPNGWAPLQWVVYAGMRRYGFDRQAERGARRWVKNNAQMYKKTGKLMEKYNVDLIGDFTGGGEYEVQHGFGWTNGVLVTLMDELGMS